ncbi:hypothetical protein HZA97_00080 [Candidatus Woesearchaeota archaeon]|nr:hypothetical protein [Candidatus Woesearchaeota archaeon]
MVITQNKTSRKIIDKLRLKKEKIISKEEIFRVIREYEKIYEKKVNLISMWTYLRKSKYIKRILGDYYYVYSLEEMHNKYCRFSEEELIFLVLEKMRIKWYLGLECALIENKIIWQTLNVVLIINDYFSGFKKLENTIFKFIKTHEKKFSFGLLRKKTNNQVKYFYSDLEKTYLDFLHFNSYSGKDLETIKKSIDFKVDESKLFKYAKNYSKKIQEVL